MEPLVCSWLVRSTFVTCVWSGEAGMQQFCETEPLISGISCYLWVHCVRIELNCRSPSWCWRIVWWCVKPSPLHIHIRTGNRMFYMKESPRCIFEWNKVLKSAVLSHLYEGIYHIPQCGEFSRCICKNWLTRMCLRMVSWDLRVQAEQEIFSCNLYYLNFNMYLYHLSKRFLPVFFLFINNLYPRNFATISIPMKGLRVSIFLESSRMF